MHSQERHVRGDQSVGVAVLVIHRAALVHMSCTSGLEKICARCLRPASRAHSDPDLVVRCPVVAIRGATEDRGSPRGTLHNCRRRELRRRPVLIPPSGQLVEDCLIILKNSMLIDGHHPAPPGYTQLGVPEVLQPSGLNARPSLSSHRRHSGQVPSRIELHHLCGGVHCLLLQSEETEPKIVVGISLHQGPSLNSLPCHFTPVKSRQLLGDEGQP
mmetsp:Transcript_123713/g.283636  ORF Transcript_123713/g.283636 Transcript_123713/m.283636 type:complete len:215 (-) Transcript_123713:425-1069(-)